MSKAIIIITHKKSAQALLESAEMICGKQENVAAIEFLEQEDVATLIEKCKAVLKVLDTKEGVLYLVDLFGGSPFHAAYLLASGQEDQHVITGVNLPMLMETFLSREQKTMEELVDSAVQSAREGIKHAENQSILGSDDE